MAKKQLIIDWYKQFGWKDNPFKPEILRPIEEFVVGFERERQKINYSIINRQKYGTIAGIEGIGKSTLLEWLCFELNKFKNKFVVLHIEGRKRPATDIKKSLMSSLSTRQSQSLVKSVFGRFMKKKQALPATTAVPEHDMLMRKGIMDMLKQRTLVLLIDDAIYLPQENIKFIKELLSLNIPYQIIITCLPDHAEKFSALIGQKDQLGLRIRKPLFEDFKEMVKLRIERVSGKGIEPFKNFMLEKIHEKYNSLVDMLETCRHIAMKLSIAMMSNKNLVPSMAEEDEIGEKVAEKLKELEKEAKKPEQQKQPEQKQPKEPGKKAPYVIKVEEGRKAKPYEIKVMGKKDDKGYKIVEIDESKEKKPVRVEKKKR